MLVGEIYDTESKVNLTEEQQRKINRVDVATLPLDLAIKKVKGNGARKLAVFSDADCPFCAQLEEELKNVDNVTIYTFLYPDRPAASGRRAQVADDLVRAGQGEGVGRVLRDRRAARQRGRLRQSGRQDRGARRRSCKVNATPTLVFADGSVVPGALPAQRLETELQQRRGGSEEARRGEEVVRASRVASQRESTTRWRSSIS